MTENKILERVEELKGVLREIERNMQAHIAKRANILKQIDTEIGTLNAQANATRGAIAELGRLVEGDNGVRRDTPHKDSNVVVKRDDSFNDDVGSISGIKKSKKGRKVV